MTRLVATMTVVLAAALACGTDQEPEPSGTPALTETPTAAPTTVSPTGFVLPSPASDWSIYKSALWGYTIQYPPGWYDLPNFGAPDFDKYFSNQPVTAPLGMDAMGVWITIRVSELVGEDCVNENLFGSIEATKEIQVAGIPATRYLTHDTSVEGGPRVVLNVAVNGRCYSFNVIAFSEAVRRENLPLIDRMLETFTPA